MHSQRRRVRATDVCQVTLGGRRQWVIVVLHMDLNRSDRALAVTHAAAGEWRFREYGSTVNGPPGRVFRRYKYLRYLRISLESEIRIAISVLEQRPPRETGAFRSCSRRSIVARGALTPCLCGCVLRTVKESSRLRERRWFCERGG